MAAIRIGGQTEINVAIDRERIARLGINIADVNNTIQTAFAGNAVNIFYEGDRRFDVTVRLQQRFRDAVGDIADLQVPLPGAAAAGPGASGAIALGDIAKQHQSTPASVALAWLIARPSITAPIASATSTVQLTELIEATRLQLDQASIDRLNVASS